MSRSQIAEARFRLHLSPYTLSLERIGANAPPEVLARAAPGGEPARLIAALREMAAAVDGAVSAVLPVGSFQARPAPRARGARRTAEAALAVALGVPAKAARFAESPGEPAMLVGVARATLTETRGFLAALGIEAVAVEPDDALLPGRVPVRFPLAATRFTGLALPPLRLPTLRLEGLGPRAAALAGMAAVVAAAILSGPPRAPEPGAPALRAAVAVAAPDVPTAVVRPVEPRPRSLPKPSLLTSAAPLRRPEPPAGLDSAPAITDAATPVTMASRNLPPGVLPAIAEPAGGPRYAALGPVPRPSAVPAPAPEPGALRPLRRPVAAAEAAALSETPAIGRPLARPSTTADFDAAIEAAIAEVAPAVLAALPAENAAAGLGAAVASLRPEPRGALATPVRAAPAEVARPAAAAPVQARRVAPPPQPVQVRRVVPPPQPVQVRRVAPAPQPVQVRRAALPPQPAQVRRVAAAPANPPRVAAEPTQPVRGPVTLIGVFGSADARHALLRMPNGSVERVRPGQTVAGVQVAGVADSSVRVRMNGREDVLRLPD